MIKYQNKRGGLVLLKNIKSQEIQYDGLVTCIQSLQEAVGLETTLNQQLLELHDLVSKNKDPNFENFIDNEFLKQQVDVIKELGDKVSQLKNLGDSGGSLNEYLFDQNLLNQ